MMLGVWASLDPWIDGHHYLASHIEDVYEVLRGVHGLCSCQYPFQSMSPWVHERRWDQTRQNLSPTGSTGCKSFVSPEVDPELAVEVKVTMAGFTYFGMVGMPIISGHVEQLKISDIVDSLYWCDYIVWIWFNGIGFKRKTYVDVVYCMTMYILDNIIHCMMYTGYHIE